MTKKHLDLPTQLFSNYIYMYSGFQAAVNTPEGKIFRCVRPVAPEIFDRVAFELPLFHGLFYLINTSFIDRLTIIYKYE